MDYDIQILDVDGRQCTDFQCFTAREPDKGHERAADSELWLPIFHRALADCGMEGETVETFRATLRRAARLLVNDVPDWRSESDRMSAKRSAQPSKST